MRFPRLSKDTFHLARDSALLVNAGALSGLLFLLVHPILGRSMDAVAYGQFVQLMGLLAVLGVPAGAVQVAISRYVAEFAHERQVALWVTVVRRASRRLAWVAGGAMLAWLALSVPLAHWLQVSSSWSLVILGFATAISLYQPIVYGTLQGSMLFRWFALGTLSAGVLRVLFCGGMALGHGSVNGALVAVAASMLGCLLIGWWPFRHLVASVPGLPDFDTGPIYRYLWPVLGGQAAVFMLINADLILSARLLSPEDLGVYGKVAMLSRTVLFLAQPIALAMFPRVVNSASLRLLLIPLGAAFAITLAGAIGLTLLPALPMRLMYGVQGPACDHLTRLYVWAALPHAMVIFIAQYLWARHQTARVLLLLPILAGYVLALFRCEGSPVAIVTALAFAGWAAMAVLIGGVVAGRRWAAPRKDILA